MTIKEFALVTGLNAHTLRYYEKIGVIPRVPRDRNGIRNYSEEYVQQVELIQQLKTSGMTLENIIIYLHTQGRSREAQKQRRQVLLQTKNELLRKAQEIQEALLAVEEQLNSYPGMFKQAPAYPQAM